MPPKPPRAKKPWIIKKPKTPSTASTLKRKRKKRPLKKPSWEIAMEQAVLQMDDEAIGDQYPQVMEAFHGKVDEGKFEMIYKEMKHEWQVFKYCNDLKDMYISKLKDDMHVLQEQRTIMKYKEMDLIDEMLAHFSHTVEKAMDQYQHRRDRLMRERFNFLNRNFKSAHQDAQYIANMKEIMIEEHAQDMDLVTGKNIYEKNEQIMKNEKDRKHLLNDSLKDMLDTFCEIRNIYTTYIKKTERKRKAFALLKAKDKKDDIIIDKLRNKIASLHVERENITKKIKIEHINVSKIEDLESEKSTLVEMLVKMRAQLKNDYAEDGTKLMHLTNLCSNVIKEVKDQEVLGEKILKYIILSHKYETLNEKIEPYSTLIERIDIAFNEEFPEYRDLDKFLFRMAQIEIHVDCMEKILEKYRAQETLLKALVCEAVNTVFK